MNTMKKETSFHPLPSWMKMDNRPLDTGVWREFGYGYSRKVGKQELWKPATRCFIRKDQNGFNNYYEARLLPGAYWVSTHGKVFSAIIGKLICNRRTHCRKELALLTEDHTEIRTRRYRLVIDNFIEPPEKTKNIIRYLLGTVNHLDGITWHDRIDNLEYASVQTNIDHFNKKLRKNENTKNTNKRRKTYDAKDNA